MIRETWNALVRYNEWQPGNATRYSVIVTPINGEQANQSSGFSTYNGFLVSLVNFPGVPTMLVPSYMRPDMHYVADKMGLGLADAKQISEFVNEILKGQ